MDILKPKSSATLRRPTDNNRNHGLIVNPPRFAQMGGLTGASKVGNAGMKVAKPADGKKVIKG